MTSTSPRLGVDIGRVIIDGSSHPSGDDTSFISGTDSDALATPAMSGAFQALRRLNAVFDGRVWLVSKCHARVQGRSERWLAHHRFFEATGIDPGNLRFCRERPDKAVHCAQLDITHFIDDRADVLEHLRGIVGHLFLFGPQRRRHPDLGATATLTWADAERAVLATIQTPHTATATP